MVGRGLLLICSVPSRNLFGNGLPSELVVPLMLSPWLKTLKHKSLGNSLLSLLLGSQCSHDSGIRMTERLGSPRSPRELTFLKILLQALIMSFPCDLTVGQVRKNSVCHIGWRSTGKQYLTERVQR